MVPGRHFPVLMGTGDPGFPFMPLHTFITGHSDTTTTAGDNYSFRMHINIPEAKYTEESQGKYLLLLP